MGESKAGRRRVANQGEGLKDRGTRKLVDRSRRDRNPSRLAARPTNAVQVTPWLGHEGIKTLPQGARLVLTQLGVELTRRRR